MAIKKRIFLRLPLPAEQNLIIIIVCCSIMPLILFFSCVFLVKSIWQFLSRNPLKFKTYKKRDVGFEFQALYLAWLIHSALSEGRLYVFLFTRLDPLFSSYYLGEVVLVKFIKLLIEFNKVEQVLIEECCRGEGHQDLLINQNKKNEKNRNRSYFLYDGYDENNNKNMTVH